MPMGTMSTDDQLSMFDEKSDSQQPLAAVVVTSDSTTEQTKAIRDVTAEWRVATKEKLYKIEFEHGTATGKRVLWIDDKEVFRRDWMFKLVGDDTFQLENMRCVIRVDPAASFKYKYLLFVDGRPFEQYRERQAKTLKIWETDCTGRTYRIVLERGTLNLFLNGKLREETGEFVDGGTETIFTDNENTFILSARTSGNKRDGLMHTLIVNGTHINEIIDE